MLNLIERDSYLEPYTLEIDGRYRYFLQKEKELTKNGRQTLSSFASGYLYFGLHRTSTGWCFREWAPNAKKIVLIGDFSNWEERPEYELKALPGGVWERRLPRKALVHGQHYKMKVYWDGGCGERIPAWTRRVVQDEATKIFSAQVWC
ncbi:MAG: 1,4-alpha-glucan-branching enzyme, partial [Bacteroidaceae bacterium]|nr:1,4-alpha-glucan-branching enzyme [Bacteroidaceae bacterium]